MSRTKEIGTAVGTLACALGIGFAMQSSDQAKSLYESESNQPAPPAEIVLDVEEITLTSSLPAMESRVSTNPAPESVLPTPAEITAPEIAEPAAPATAAEESSCDIMAEATPAPAATVAISLAAPCYPNERLTVHHSGMLFTAITDQDGRLELSIPALAKNAVVIFAFSNGEGTGAVATIEDVAAFERVVLQWKGNTGFQLHAREFGAGYGEAGHVWRDSAEGLSRLLGGEGGALLRMGDTRADSPLLAEVYTVPAAILSNEADIDLSVETEVTAANCGLEVEAQTIELRAGGELRTRDIILSVPDCGAVGDFLVLNNLLEDLKLSAR